MGQRPFIVVGDQTDHGGVVVEGSVMTDTHGKQIARVGDQVTCPKRNHGTTVIVTGDPTMIIDGKPAARHGDRCACGAILISSQFVSTVSDGGSSNPQAAGEAQRAGAAAAGLISKLMPQYDDKLVLIDDATGQPLSHAQYAIKRASGELEFGTTDDDGYTHLLSATADSEMVEIYV
ncbi:MAG: PAAR domain-containing protein [Burkholderiales bacterium]|nr:MAG: PAAR domain-containing protein [Burkholderiales bacterium]